MKDSNNMRKSLAIVAVSLVGVCLISSFLTYQFLAQQCLFWTCAPLRAFSIYDLTLPTNLFPENAVINPMISSPESPGVESGVLAVYWEENGQVYKSIFLVDRFGTIDRAVKYFNTVKTLRSRASYHSHSDITYQSEIANDFEIGCGIGQLGGEYVCSLDARYEEFVISLNSSMSGQMDQKMFQQIVISIDKQFEEYLLID